MRKVGLFCGVVLPVALLAGCGGAGSPMSSTPAPTAAATPLPPPTPVTVPQPNVNYDTVEYRRSNAAAQAQALVAYNAGATGASVVVGVIDSGVDTSSAEFTGRISPLSADFAGTRGIDDSDGHGTAVSDVLLGANNGDGVHGVAFGATLLALRTDTPGTCTSVVKATSEAGCSHNDNAIAAALDVAVTARARVVNISLGGSAPNSRLRMAIDQATSAGVIIVISAGNDGKNDPLAAVNPDALAQVANDPISHGLVIVAGALDATSTLADFSNKAGTSSAHYLAALGVDVRSIDNNGNGYYFSGTSFSAPAIAGAVALLAQAFPNLTPAQIVSLLYRSATDLGSAGVDGIYGNGELNIARAFQPQGATSLAASAVAVSMTDNATLGTAMGDAGQGGLAAVIRDEYGRDFDVDLAATIRHSATSRSLAPGLALSGRSLSATGGRTSIALAISDTAEPQRLMLGRGQAEQARVLAGAVAIAVTRDLRLGFGGGRGAEGLAPAPRETGTPAFLISDRSLEREPVGAFAMRQRLGGIGLSVSAESGDMRLWERGSIGPIGDGYRRYPYATMSAGIDGRTGPLVVGGRISRMEERATVLGGRLGPALGGNGAVSWFADARAVLAPLDRLTLTATVRRGWTQLSGTSVRGATTLATQSLSADIRRDDMLTAGDSFALRYSEPLRVTRGTLALELGGAAPTRLSLAPTGHERDVEAVYQRPLGLGMLTANAYLRRQAGNFASAPDDLGLAVRYAFGF